MNVSGCERSLHVHHVHVHVHVRVHHVNAHKSDGGSDDVYVVPP